MESTQRQPESIPADARLPLLVYRIIFPLLFVISLPFYLLRLWRRESGRATHKKPAGYHLGISQRFGGYTENEREWCAQKSPLWVHSISVGETLVALKLAREIHTQDPGQRIFLTTTTSTGFEVALENTKDCDWLMVSYNPIDLRRVVSRALKAIRPAKVILIEGEVWPNLISLCRNKGIPVLLANARMSARSGRRFEKFAKWSGPIFRMLDRIFVQDSVDAERFARIGATSAQIKTVGNIKFDAAESVQTSRIDEFRALTRSIGFQESDRVIVAGSTWSPEEKDIGEIFNDLRRDFSGLRLIVVPRHVERSERVVEELKALKLRVVKRSNLPFLEKTEADVIVVDTTGELRDWFALASIAFIGKSLPGIAEKGGQNPGEPAGLGIPILCGPHMGNFSTLVSQLVREKGIVQVSNLDGLRDRLRELLHDKMLRANLGQSAARMMKSHFGATNHTARGILNEC